MECRGRLLFFKRFDFKKFQINKCCIHLVICLITIALQYAINCSKKSKIMMFLTHSPPVPRVFRFLLRRHRRCAREAGSKGASHWARQQRRSPRPPRRGRRRRKWPFTYDVCNDGGRGIDPSIQKFVLMGFMHVIVNMGGGLKSRKYCRCHL